MPAFLFRTQTRKPRGEEAALPLSNLGRGLKVQGVLDTEGELQVHGNVRGRINAGLLVLASSADVEGDIVARDVRILGRLFGRIFALNVTLESSADVVGRIFHNSITVARGARFEGRMPWRPPSYFETLEQLPETRP